MPQDSTIDFEGAEINLYSKASKEIMMKLGFVPADLEPLNESDIYVPQKFEEFRDQYVQGKLEYAEKLRMKRLKQFIQQINASKNNKGDSNNKGKKISSRLSRTANLSKNNLNRVFAQQTSSKGKALVSMMSNVSKKFSQVDQEAVNIIQQLANQNQIKTLSMPQKKLLYKQALKCNSNLLDSVYPGVKRNHLKENLLLRPKIQKMKKFNLKQNIKAQQAEIRRTKSNRIISRIHLKFFQNQSQVVKRLQELQQLKKLHLQKKKRSRDEKFLSSKIKQIQQKQMNSDIKYNLKKNLTYRISNAEKIKDDYNKSKIKCNMASYYKMDEVNRSKNIYERKRLKRNPFEKIRLPKSKSNHCLSKRYKMRTQGSRDQMLTRVSCQNFYYSNYEEGGSPFFDKKDVIQNELVLETPGMQYFFERIKEYIACQKIGGQSKIQSGELRGLQEQCKRVNLVLEERYKDRDL